MTSDATRQPVPVRSRVEGVGSTCSWLLCAVKNIAPFFLACEAFFAQAAANPLHTPKWKCVSQSDTHLQDGRLTDGDGLADRQMLSLILSPSD